MRSLNSTQKGSVTEVKGVTGASDSHAIELLKRSGWDAQRAINLFFDSDSSGGPMGKQQQVSSTLQNTFKQYSTTTTTGDEIIDVNGLTKLFQDLGIDIMDPLTLMISYHCNAKQNGTYTKAQFTSGMQKLGCNTINDLKAKLPKIRQEFQKNDEAFKQLYLFTFDFSKEVGKKHLAFESARILWEVLLDGVFPFLTKFLEFLDGFPENKRTDISMDTWSMLLEFHNVTKGDKSKYDPMGAWPCLIDEFMEFLN